MLRKSVGLAILTLSSCVFAAETIPMYLVAEQGQGKSIGTITIEDSTCGVLIKPNLHDLPPGLHGFHVHEVPNCGDKGMAAGGHLDPEKADAHNGPYEHHSHLGDLPVLIVDNSGKATLPTLAPRFKVSNIKGHALMIHAGGDNYSDKPEKLGGGGERIACGIIPGNGSKKNGVVVPPTKTTTTTETTTVIPATEETVTEVVVPAETVVTPTETTVIREERP